MIVRHGSCPQGVSLARFFQWRIQKCKEREGTKELEEFFEGGKTVKQCQNWANIMTE